MTVYRMTRAAEMEVLPVLREFIDKIAADADIGGDMAYDLKLAVDEAATNVIEHGYAGMDPGSLCLEMYVDARQVIMTLQDWGHPFEPQEPDAPDIAAAIEGDEDVRGFGLLFIYQTMDEVDYETDSDGNRLILMRKRPAEAAHGVHD